MKKYEKKSMTQCICQNPNCGKEFERDTWKVKNGYAGKYCGRKCSCQMTGKLSTTPWNAGLDGTDPKVAARNAKQSQTMLAKAANHELVVWNKGMTKNDDPRMALMVQKQTVIRNTPGPRKDAWRAALTKGQVAAHAAGKYPFKFTKPEKLTWAYLESKGCLVKEYANKADSDPDGTWYHNFPVESKFVADFGCPSKKAVIEVNGCYVHHHNPEKCTHRTVKYDNSGWGESNIKKDRRKYSYYHRNSWKWALVWECEAEKGDFHRI